MQHLPRRAPSLKLNSFHCTCSAQGGRVRRKKVFKKTQKGVLTEMQIAPVDFRLDFTVFLMPANGLPVELQLDSIEHEFSLVFRLHVCVLSYS